MSTLLLFAHAGEAQSFIRELALKPVVLNPKLRLYRGETYCVFITGEGQQEVLFTLSSLLSQQSFQQVINFGIAGSLHPQAKKYQIYPVSIAYGEEQFKSFPSQSSQGLSCLSAKARLLTTEHKKKLAPLAYLVDRELWAIGYVCQKYGLPFASYKLVSDILEETAACNLIQSQAADISQQLWSFFERLAPVREKPNLDTSLPQGFYFTTDLKRRYLSYFQQLQKKEERGPQELEQSLGFDELREAELSPKDKAKRLVEQMQLRLNPLRRELLQKLAPYLPHQSTFQYAPDWEQGALSLSAKLKSENDKTQLIQELQQLSLATIQKMLQGEPDV